MANRAPFRASLLALVLAYVVSRTYYRRRARRPGVSGKPRDPAPLEAVTENKGRLLMLGITGLSADGLAVLWSIKPSSLDWANLPLPAWLRWVGVPLGAASTWLSICTLRALGPSYTETLKTKADHHLVTDGIYAHVRHPMYTSFFALLAAYFLLSANWLIGGLGLAYSLLIVERAAHEEHMMLHVFGSEYGQYAQRTGRFLPRLFRKAVYR
jgi:protein-S-isoprenylcysteine O-methyltransferase Ste14